MPFFLIQKLVDKYDVVNLLLTIIMCLELGAVLGSLIIGWKLIIIMTLNKPRLRKLFKTCHIHAVLVLAIWRKILRSNLFFELYAFIILTSTLVLGILVKSFSPLLQKTNKNLLLSEGGCRFTRSRKHNSCQLHRSQKERCLRFIQEKVQSCTTWR